MKLQKIINKCLRPTSGFTQAGVYARRQFCGDLEVYRPPEQNHKICICRQNEAEVGQNTEKQHIR